MKLVVDLTKLDNEITSELAEPIAKELRDALLSIDNSTDNFGNKLQGIWYIMQDENDIPGLANNH